MIDNGQNVCPSFVETADLHNNWNRVKAVAFNIILWYHWFKYVEFNLSSHPACFWVQQENKFYLLDLDAAKNKQRKGQNHSALTACPEPWSDHVREHCSKQEDKIEAKGGDKTDF